MPGLSPTGHAAEHLHVIGLYQTARDVGRQIPADQMHQPLAVQHQHHDHRDKHQELQQVGRHHARETGQCQAAVPQRVQEHCAAPTADHGEEPAYAAVRRGVGDAEPGHRGVQRMPERRDHAADQYRHPDVAGLRAQALHVVEDVFDQREPQPAHPGVDDPVRRPIDLVPPHPQQVKQQRALEALLDHRRHDRHRDRCGGLGAQHRCHQDLAAGVHDQRPDDGHPGTPAQGQPQVELRLRFQPVDQKDQRDEHHRGRQREPGADHDVHRAALPQVESQRQQQAETGDRQADDQRYRRAVGASAFQDGPRTECGHARERRR